MHRTRILLVPTVTEVEWKIKPLIEEWAEVASYDAPGVGTEPGTEMRRQAIVDRGIAEIEARNWTKCVVVGDEAGAAQAVRIAATVPTAIDAVALGHAALSFRRDGPSPDLNSDVFDALMQVARTDYRSFVRALCQITQHAYDDELADAYLERVPQEVAIAYMSDMLSGSEPQRLEEDLRALDVPMLFVEHRGCIGWTPESFRRAVAAFPDAATASVEIKPNCEPRFAEILKEFCEGLPTSSGAAAADRAT